MPNLLAIDTSSTYCAVALSSAGTLIARNSSASRQSAQQILPMIAEILNESDIDLKALDAIAVLAGPGSFTGIRIGIGVAQGLGMANSTPVLTLSSLAVKAMAAFRLSNQPFQLVAEMARDGEVYFAAYQSSSTLGVKLVGTEQVGVPADLQLHPEILSHMTKCQAVGDAWQQIDNLAACLNLELTSAVINPPVEIKDLCELAGCRYDNNEGMAAELAAPNYVKERLHYSR